MTEQWKKIVELFLSRIMSLCNALSPAEWKEERYSCLTEPTGCEVEGSLFIAAKLGTLTEYSSYKYIFVGN